MGRLVYGVIFLVFLSGYVRGEEGKYKISGTVAEGIKGELRLIKVGVGRNDTIGQTMVRNGKFLLEGELSKPSLVYIRTESMLRGVGFLLEAGVDYKMNIGQKGDIEVKGGKLQEALNTYWKMMEKSGQELKTLTREAKKAEAGKRMRTLGELKNRMAEVRKVAAKELRAEVETNRNTLFAAYVLTSGAGQMKLPQLKKCYQQLTEAERQMVPAKIVAQRIEHLEQIELESLAPDFTLATPGGERVTIHEVKGKLKIIDFWASWCGPCRLENPNMVKLYQDFKDKGLAVISVSLDEDRQKWTQAIEKDGLTWIQLSSLKGWQDEVVKMYNVEGIPAIFVLDENNRIIAKQLRAEKLREFVSEYLK